MSGAHPQADRATHESNPQAVSTVPVGIPCAGVELDWIGGACPVQAQGEVDGHPFYFRARGDGWEFWVGEPWTADAFLLDGPYGKWPAAGWMPENVARHLIAAGCEAFRDLGFPEAQAIEARRAATGTGAVHESAVPQGMRPEEGL